MFGFIGDLNVEIEAMRRGSRTEEKVHRASGNNMYLQNIVLRHIKQLFNYNLNRILHWLLLKKRKVHEHGHNVAIYKFTKQKNSDINIDNVPDSLTSQQWAWEPARGLMNRNHPAFQVQQLISDWSTEYAICLVTRSTMLLDDWPNITNLS